MGLNYIKFREIWEYHRLCGHQIMPNYIKFREPLVDFVTSACSSLANYIKFRERQIIVSGMDIPLPNYIRFRESERTSLWKE